MSKEEMEKSRREICNSCPEYNKENDKCKACGCFLGLKVRNENASCPLKKW